MAGQYAALIEALPTPRIVWVMVPAGAITDSVIDELSGLLAEDDLVIEEGRAHKLKLLLVAESAETLLAADDANAVLDCVDEADAGYVTVQTSPWSKVSATG